MTLFHIIVLALVQGVTEFLPISSSAHLVLVPYFTGWDDQGLIIDVAVHVGTLGAVVVYLWRDVAAILGDLAGAARGRRAGPGVRLAGLIIVATVPVVGAGFAFNGWYPDGLRSITVIAWATLGFGLVLFAADRFGLTVRRMEHLKLSDTIIIGLAQVLALIPGTSRSGITMTAARLLGIERTHAARFSMLLAIPAITGAGVLKGIDLVQAGDAQLTTASVTAAALSFVTALIAIALMMAWLKRATFTPFVLYRVVLGCVLLALAYGGV
ncbi:MAG: undecaprenyl-diphosphate phosphatase [Rhodospirillales bacterium]|nr:undecaprenyl-diphosphate phosphatase [Rhodospirillales bacterium]